MSNDQDKKPPGGGNKGTGSGAGAGMGYRPAAPTLQPPAPRPPGMPASMPTYVKAPQKPQAPAAAPLVPNSKDPSKESK